MVTPQVLLESLVEGGVEYPPPSPPPPSPPVVPPAPVTPPSPYTCSARALPSVANVKDHSFGAWNPEDPISRASRSVPCWRWDEAGVWPPQQTHQDIFQELEVCGWRSSRSVQWQSGFRQPTLDSIYRNQFNEDACIWANDGVCQDGGDGDYQSSDTTVIEAGAARVLPGNVFNFSRIQSDVPLPSVGTYLMISLVDWRQDGVASNHPSVSPENVCLHGGNANSQTGPLRVKNSGTYDNPIDSNPLGFIEAEPVPGVTVYASGRASCDPCSADGYGCGTCDEFAMSSNQADWASYSAVSAQQERPFDCMDVTGVILAPVRRQCNYGSCALFDSNVVVLPTSLLRKLRLHCRDRSDCGDREDIVSYGYSNADVASVAYDWPQSISENGARPSKSTSADALSRNSVCNDAGGVEFMGALFGSDSADCGRRHLTLPASKTGAKVPDDSCATAKNGRCEDQLFFSVLFPNGNRANQAAKCIPNT